MDDMKLFPQIQKRGCDRCQKAGDYSHKKCANKTLDRMTVHSSPYAVPIYHKLGFCDTGTKQVVNGLRFTPMELE